jgi:predicted ribosome quality control (RQC) complex YloA/Tae2 family protein
MKPQLSAFDIHYLVKELQILVKGKLMKAYSPDKKELLLTFHLPGQGKKMIKIAPPSLLHFVETKEDMPENPSGFCMFMRKHLENVKVNGIRQVGFERIIEFDFGELIMAVELFSKGNCIIYADKIQAVLEPQKWRDRELKVGLPYVPPKPQRNPYDIDEKTLSEILKSSSGLAKSLAIDCALGGTIAEEVAFRSGIDKKAKELDPKKVFKAMSEVLNEPSHPIIASENNIPVAIAPIRLKLYSEISEFPSFSEALAFAFKEIKVSRYSAEIARLQKIIANQEEQMEEFKRSAKENQEKADLIYQNYQLIDEVIKEIKKAREKFSWTEIKEKLQGHKIIKEVNLKEKEVSLLL